MTPFASGTIHSTSQSTSSHPFGWDLGETEGRFRMTTWVHQSGWLVPVRHKVDSIEKRKWQERGQIGCARSVLGIGVTLRSGIRPPIDQSSHLFVKVKAHSMDHFVHQYINRDRDDSKALCSTQSTIRAKVEPSKLTAVPQRRYAFYISFLRGLEEIRTGMEHRPGIFSTGRIAESKFTVHFPLHNHPARTLL